MSVKKATVALKIACAKSVVMEMSTAVSNVMEQTETVVITIVTPLADVSFAVMVRLTAANNAMAIVIVPAAKCASIAGARQHVSGFADVILSWAL